MSSTIETARPRNAITALLWRVHAATWLPVLLILASLVPIWSVRYPALHDYQNHLLEAQVVAHYTDPALDYAMGYQIRPRWWASSNALTTLALVELMRFLPPALAGKFVLSLYVVLLLGGLAVLLVYERRPVWLLLLAIPLVYAMPFTAGMLNWCYGFALTIWAIVCYLKWRDEDRLWLLLALALLSLLIYMAHVFAWALCLLVLLSMAVANSLSSRRFLLLLAALSVAMPLLLVTRPVLALVPPVFGGTLWLLAATIRRLRLRPITVALIGGACALLLMVGLKLTKAWIVAQFPDVDYSGYAKLTAWPRLFALPQYAVPVSWGAVAANVALLAGLGLAAVLLFWSNVRRRRIDSAQMTWLVPAGVLLLVYLLIPYRTTDIIGTELRIIQLFCVIGLMGLSGVLPGHRLTRMFAGLAVVIGMIGIIAANLYAWRYDRLARDWAAYLVAIPARSRVLVLSNPLAVPEGTWNWLARSSLFFDGNQFSNLYGLERGGFVSNTFFNGPLQPRPEQPIPLYWWIAFNPGVWTTDHCTELREQYDVVIAWNAYGTELQHALEGCFGTAATSDGSLDIWERR